MDPAQRAAENMRELMTLGWHATSPKNPTAPNFTEMADRWLQLTPHEQDEVMATVLGHFLALIAHHAESIDLQPDDYFERTLLNLTAYWDRPELERLTPIDPY